ncbi:hypothetical protein CsSME_00051993 [Camellia sinensis var. sinensis]
MGVGCISRAAVPLPLSYLVDTATLEGIKKSMPLTPSGPVLIMVLEKVNAVADWRAMIGPTDARKAKVTHPNSIRAMCGLDSQTNCVHGSDSSESAAREISFFFKEASSVVYCEIEDVAFVD